MSDNTKHRKNDFIEFLGHPIESKPYATDVTHMEKYFLWYWVLPQRKYTCNSLSEAKNQSISDFILEQEAESLFYFLAGKCDPISWLSDQIF